MPKDRRSPSLDRFRVSPYSHNYQDNRKTRPITPSLPIGNENEWEETKCPICMDHPHNAVLLLCSSREKGCLPYICSTSSRHSNCLDQFHNTLQEVNEIGETKLVCPLCRGQINGWIVVKPARQFMDSKVRSCSSETCDFSGNYSQLRKHARCQHPNIRPTDVDPERELEWRILEEDLARQDMLSMQYEYDDDDDEILQIEEVMVNGIPDLNLPYGLDHDFTRFLFLIHTGYFHESAIDTDTELNMDTIIFPEVDFDSGPAAHTHNRSVMNRLEYSYSRLSGRPRENGPTHTNNRLPEISREYRPFDANSGFSERRRAYGQTNTHNMLSERPRRSYGGSDGHHRLSEGAREYDLTARNRSNTHIRRRSNSQPSSRNANREEQLSTIVEFHYENLR